MRRRTVLAALSTTLSGCVAFGSSADETETTPADGSADTPTARQHRTGTTHPTRDDAPADTRTDSPHGSESETPTDAESTDTASTAETPQPTTAGTPTVTGAWRHPLHDAGHSGYTTTTDESGETPGETGSAAGPTDTPATAWQHELDDSPTAPVVADGRLYVAAGGQLSCLDATTGDRQWHHDHRGSRSFRVSVVAGTVFVGSETAVTAVAADTGRERWHFAPASDTTLFPVVGSNAVYVTESATISALDRETGSRRWTTSLDRGGPFERPAPAGDTVYVSDSASAGRLLAFDTADGTVRWETDGVGSHPTAVTVHDGRVFLGEFYGSVTALTTEGESAWTGQAGPPVGRIVAGPESVYAHGHGGSGDVVVASLDAASGDQQWTRATGYPLAATTDRVYLAEASQTTAAAADTGEPQWTVDTSGSRAAVTDDSLFLSTDTGVRALTTTT